MPLAKSLDGLRSLIAPSEHYRPSLETFPKLNIEQILRNRHILERAEQRGQANQPPSDSNAPDPVEIELLEAVQHELSASQNRYLDEQELYDERLQNLNFQGKFAFVDAAVAQAVSDFRVEASFNSSISLVAHRENLKDAHLERSGFIKRHRLQRVAKYPSPAGKTLHIGIVALLFLIEAVVNGAFLRKGGGGWVGGVATAIAFAFVNIIFSGLISHYLVRELFHRNFIRKFFGLLSAIFLLILTLAVNTVLANYREVSMDLNAVNVEQTVVEKMHGGLKEFPAHALDLFAFHNIETYVLLLVGVLFAIVTVIEVLRFDDVYPGYGDVDRRYRKQHEIYEDEVAAKIEELQAMRDEATDTLDGLKREFSNRLEEYQFILTRRRALYQTFLSYVSELQQGLDNLVRDYRQKNMAHRTAPAPKFFQNSVRLPQPYIVEPLAKEEDIRELNREFERIVSTLTSQSSNLHAEFERAALNFRGSEQIMSGPTNVDL